MPLLTATDPLILGCLKGTDLSAEKLNEEALPKLQAAEKALRRAMKHELGSAREALAAMEESLPTAVASHADVLGLPAEALEKWRALAMMLFSGGVDGFIRLQKDRMKSQKMAALSATFSVGPSVGVLPKGKSKRARKSHG